MHNATTNEFRQLSLAELLAAAASAAPSRDPSTYKEAMKGADAEEWTDACKYEMDALWKNDTWKLVELPPGRKANQNRFLN